MRVGDAISRIDRLQHFDMYLIRRLSNAQMRNFLFLKFGVLAEKNRIDSSTVMTLTLWRCLANDHD